MKKINLYVVVAALLCSTAIQASEQAGEFLGGYFGGKLGINNSKATGTINAPGESTLAYIVQGGYIQGGYNRKFGASVIGVGGYADLHGYERHSNGIKYGGQAYGLDIRLGLLKENWLPYVKLGYGYSSGTSDLRDIKQYGHNKSIGVEYKLDPHWSLVAEYKTNSFGKYSTTVVNNTTLLGFNFYLEKPVVIVEAEPEIDLTEPAPVAAPDVAPEFAPPP